VILKNSRLTQILISNGSDNYVKWWLVVSSERSTVSPPNRPLQSVSFVGPATAAVLEREGYDTTAITDKRVSYRLLVDVGVNPGVAAKIRREHSLSWSFRSGGDLDRRSAQIRGLGSAEAAWVAASAGNWENADESPEADDTDEQTEAVDTDGSTEAVDTGEQTEAVDTDGNPNGDLGWAAERTPWPTHSESVNPAVAGGTDASEDAISAEAAWRARSKPTPVDELAVVDAAAADRLGEAGITSVRSLATANPQQVADVLELPVPVVDEWYQAARNAVGCSE